ncbi:MAG: hypothetical protein ACD_49C00036G0003 [uncultured bacterium (gcode 4)]|uniref:Lipoprotein n=1 Tax=uncultured bacterium (gcode 4) TaxID=1234023 RepID=K2AES8_9BACT|nr:MAG: hypothetical protein ACD_49C00036G0003 [uncultured bacterium (gcode 4)]
MRNKTNTLGVKTKLITLLTLTLLLASCGTQKNELRPEKIISNSGMNIEIAEDIDSGVSVDITDSGASLSVSASGVKINSNSGEISVNDWDKNNVKISNGKTTISSDNGTKVEVNSGVNINSAEISKETQETLKDIDKLLNSIN